MKTKEQRLDDYYEVLWRCFDSDKRLQYVIENLGNFDDDCRVDLFRDSYSAAHSGFSVLTEKKMKQIYKGHVSELPKEITGKEKITIYRGGTERSVFYKNAFSWTLNFKIAEWFANRTIGKCYNKHVVSAEIEVKHILDYINDRKEQEVLVLPSKLKNITLIPFEEKNEKFPYHD